MPPAWPTGTRPARAPGAATAFPGWPASAPASATPRPRFATSISTSHAFILRNGFHANGDQTGSGFSSFTYRPFTLEGNFLAMEAVHEMLLQSWSANPAAGTRASSACSPPPLGAGTTRPLRTCAPKAATAFPPGARTTPRLGSIVAGSDGLVRIRDNFGGRVPHGAAGREASRRRLTKSPFSAARPLKPRCPSPLRPHRHPRMPLNRWSSATEPTAAAQLPGCP